MGNHDWHHHPFADTRGCKRCGKVYSNAQIASMRYEYPNVCEVGRMNYWLARLFVKILTALGFKFPQ